MLCLDVVAVFQLAKADPHPTVRDAQFRGQGRGGRPAFTVAVGEGAQGAQETKIGEPKAFVENGSRGDNGQVAGASGLGWRAGGHDAPSMPSSKPRAIAFKISMCAWIARSSWTSSARATISTFSSLESRAATFVMASGLSL